MFSCMETCPTPYAGSEPFDGFLFFYWLQALEKDCIPNLLKRLSNLNYEIHDYEKKRDDRISLKLLTLNELQRQGLHEQSDFKIYLDENPAIKLELTAQELSWRRWLTNH